MLHLKLHISELILKYTLNFVLKDASIFLWHMYMQLQLFFVIQAEYWWFHLLIEVKEGFISSPRMANFPLIRGF